MNPTRLKTGDVLHCTSNNMLDKIKLKFTKAQFTHTALFIEVWGQPFILDVQKDGVNLRSWDTWLYEYDYNITISRRVDVPDPNGISKRAVTQIGRKGYLKDGSNYVAWVYAVEKNYNLSADDLYNWCKNNYFEEVKI